MVQDVEVVPGRRDRSAQDRRPLGLAAHQGQHRRRPHDHRGKSARQSGKDRPQVPLYRRARTCRGACQRPRSLLHGLLVRGGGMRDLDGGRRLCGSHLPDRAGQCDRQSDRAGDQDFRQSEDLAHHGGAYRRRCHRRASPRDDARPGRRCADRHDRAHLQRTLDRGGVARPSRILADEALSKRVTTLSVSDAIASVAAIFVRNGCGADNAQSVARALVAAEADGLKGHGLSRIPTYLQMVRSGKIDGIARPSSTRPRPGVLAIDAANGFAYPAIDLAVAELPALAAAQGIATASIRRSNHCGETGLPCEALARKGLVALLFANTPGAMAPWGGRRPVFGTNPIAFAAPLQGREPVVVDLALSRVARGPIVAARQRGEPIPEGWALDADGNATTEPDKALGGSMIPLGGPKGAVLAFMVEVLAACLTGANLAFEASSFLDGEGPPPATGQLLVAIDPQAFGHGQFSARIAALIGAIEQQPGARLPGARRLANRARAAREGIVVPPEIEAAANV